MASFLGFVLDKRAERQVTKIWSDWVSYTFDEMFKQVDVSPKTYVKIFDDALAALYILALNKEINFFSFLEQQQSFDTINEHFGFKNTVYVRLLLDTYAKHGYLDKNDDTYIITDEYRETVKNPDQKLLFFKYLPHYRTAIEQYLYIMPLKMKSSDQVVQFMDNNKKDQNKEKEKEKEKEKTFIWDLNLTKNSMYEKLRYNTMIFGGLFKRQGKFLDVGCGNGNGTLNIWKYYLDRGYFVNSEKKIQLYGIDPSQPLLDIAQKEFPFWLSQGLKVPQKELESKYTGTFPIFKAGRASAIPYPDNFFDVLYLSQVLHYDDYERALPEMLRVIKPGGIVCGNETLTDFSHLGLQIFAGSRGGTPVNEYYRVLYECQAKQVRVFENDSIIYFKYSK